MLRNITLVIMNLIVFAGMNWPSVARADSEAIELVWRNHTSPHYNIRLVKAFNCVTRKGNEKLKIDTGLTVSYTVYYDQDKCSSDKLLHFYYKQDRYSFSKQLKADIFIKIDDDGESSIDVSIAQSPDPGGVERWFSGWCTESKRPCLNTKVSRRGHQIFDFQAQEPRGSKASYVRLGG